MSKMSKFVINVSWTNTEILDYIKENIVKGGWNTVFNFARLIMHSSKSGKISKSDLNDSLTKLGIKLTGKNMEKLLRLFSAEAEQISGPEFVQTMVGEMEATRAELVQKVFEKLDVDKDGQITIQEITGGYKADNDPEVIAKKKTEKQVLAQFLDTVEMFFITIVYSDS